MNIEAGSSIIEPGILSHRRSVGDTIRICFGDVIGVESEEAETRVAGPAGNNNLILPVDAAGLVLKIVLLRGWEGRVRINAEIRSGKIRSANVVGEILVDAPPIQIGHIPGNPLGQLTIDPDRRL